ncbi:MAG: helix-turn-helix transcriptional regulator [Bdellovibrionaceae bacterium]|nr:helix-turn-helix transcriptional regulator [Pseudobdellovibrionaceae bacterium]MBX3033531.1 helix-turn-helix transcriptional regulator [Pseudobdellovibrionaceae bacterium]
MPRIPQKLVIENRIQELRAEKGLTQEQLANAVDVTRATIISLEKGSYNPSLELAFRIAKHFGKRLDDVFMEKSNRSKP